MTLAARVVWVALLRASSATAADPCDELAGQLQTRLEMTKMVMEPEGALGAIYTRATEASSRCADNEALAYLRLRAAELGRGAIVGHEPDSARNEWRTLARELTAKFPNSVRIATISARASGAVADAKRAVDLQASYAPAVVALAAALVATDPQQAATSLAGAKNLAVVSDGYTVLARVRLALRDLDGATKAANLALHGRDMNLIEPDARDPRPLAGAHETLAMVFLEKRDFKKAAKHLELASADSEKARAILENPPPGLKKVLPKSERRDRAR